MIKGYNFHMQGKRHKKTGTVCQDYSIIHSITPSWQIVAVADGVSSSAHSEVASKLACETVCKAIEDSLPFDDFTMSFVEEDIHAVIRSAMHRAENTIEKYADDNGDDYCMYDTTLVVALYNGDTAYMGMVGDSGIVLLLDNGELLFSTPMNDSQGHVYPLRCRRSYKTSSVSDVAAVYCTTDGLFKDFFVNFGTNDKSRADKLIPYEMFGGEAEDADDFFEDFKKSFMDFCEKNDNLTDDLSVSFLMNTDKAVAKTEKEPVDFITSVRAIVSLYEDDRIREKAFCKHVQAHYTDFSDEDAQALYNEELTLADVLAKYKNTETKPEEIEEIEEASEDPAKESEPETEEAPAEEDVPSESIEDEAPDEAEPATDDSDECDESAAIADPDGDEACVTDTEPETEEAPAEEPTADEVQSESEDEAEDPEDDEDEKDRVLFNIFKRKKRNK